MSVPPPGALPLSRGAHSGAAGQRPTSTTTARLQHPAVAPSLGPARGKTPRGANRPTSRGTARLQPDAAAFVPALAPSYASPTQAAAFGPAYAPSHAPPSQAFASDPMPLPSAQPTLLPTRRRRRRRNEDEEEDEEEEDDDGEESEDRDIPKKASTIKRSGNSKVTLKKGVKFDQSAKANIKKVKSALGTTVKHRPSNVKKLKKSSPGKNTI